MDRNWELPEVRHVSVEEAWKAMPKLRQLGYGLVLVPEGWKWDPVVGRWADKPVQVTFGVCSSVWEALEGLKKQPKPGATVWSPVIVDSDPPHA